MNLARLESLREVNGLLRHYSPLFSRSLLRGSEENAAHWAPTANISETESEYLIKAELPEVTKEDVSIKLQDNLITISGERKLRKGHESENALRVESVYGTFSRSFRLPQNVDVAGIKAESKDGLLYVRVPKQPVPQSRSIDIEVR